MDPASPFRTTFRHPMLRPGVRVTRRDGSHLQVGLDRATSLVVLDNPEVRELLDALRSGAAIEPRGAALDVWLALERRDQIVDADAYFHQLPRDSPAQRARAAIFAQHPKDAPWRVIARQAARVHVDADLLGDQAAQLLTGAGVGVGAQQPSVALVIADGEVRRSRLDPLVQASTPHLVVSHNEGLARVGPFVQPGRTGCVRCMDAQLGEEDPRRGLIVEQYSDAPVPSAVAEPHDETLSLLAVAAAVADVVTFIDGDRPATWSSTIEISPGLELPRTLWKRHPRCGCSWAETP